ncbi:uncharacterized protein LOC135822252 [Sycon ciliatum]|uniref:uncharacterized protein LOC135822252 n=1 Tax=Sycon ciliatum TaxID=27933 RepID=UPI0031F71C4E
MAMNSRGHLATFFILAMVAHALGRVAHPIAETPTCIITDRIPLDDPNKVLITVNSSSPIRSGNITSSKDTSNTEPSTDVCARCNPDNKDPESDIPGEQRAYRCAHVDCFDALTDQHAILLDNNAYCCIETTAHVLHKDGTRSQCVSRQMYHRAFAQTCPHEINLDTQPTTTPLAGFSYVRNTEIGMVMHFNLVSDFSVNVWHEKKDLSERCSLIVKRAPNTDARDCQQTAGFRCPTATVDMAGTYTMVISLPYADGTVKNWTYTHFFSPSPSCQSIICGKYGSCSVNKYGDYCECFSERFGQRCQYACVPDSIERLGNKTIQDWQCPFEQTLHCNVPEYDANFVTWLDGNVTIEGTGDYLTLDLKNVTSSHEFRCELNGTTKMIYNLTVRTGAKVDHDLLQRQRDKGLLSLSDHPYIECAAQTDVYPATLYIWAPKPANGKIDRVQHCIIGGSRSRIVRLKDSPECAITYQCQLYNIKNVNEKIGIDYAFKPSSSDHIPSTGRDIAISIAVVACIGIAVLSLYVRHRRIQRRENQPLVPSVPRRYGTITTETGKGQIAAENPTVHKSRSTPPRNEEALESSRGTESSEETPSSAINASIAIPTRDSHPHAIGALPDMPPVSRSLLRPYKNDDVARKGNLSLLDHNDLLTEQDLA